MDLELVFFLLPPRPCPRPHHWVLRNLHPRVRQHLQGLGPVSQPWSDSAHLWPQILRCPQDKVQTFWKVTSQALIAGMTLPYVQLQLLLPTSPSHDGSVSAQQLWPAQRCCCIHARGGHSIPSLWEHEALFLSLLFYMKNSCYLFISKSFSTPQPFHAVNLCLLGHLCTRGTCCAVLHYPLMQCWSPPQDYEIP